ncbi:hypothetical protein A9179_19135 [Pseudomonas alcaligenes]|uniref:4-hydroxyacetophenone monooxygenase n=1 Tax=Aquipseudomonas alcaligenes TaxID=43263 RepID=A0ABR7S6Q1_AQUAC|nr:NAD(P)/FAD-dependent oxidoreductase [Pseudomonas alcaligenes]MBC9252392.1 hypothetical protein [Pseudomonas alcaligenes]
MSRVHEYLIVGSGFSGLGMAIQLKRSGREDFLILEKAADVGGCWRDNTYPGCGCDIPSHLYSFSFEQRADWSRKYPLREEIHAYLQHCVNKYGLDPHLRLNCTVQRLRYLDAEQVWQVELVDGSSLRARFVILGKGPLHVPTLPELPGLERFTGAVFHSSHWDHGYDLRGKRVASIGTGASAIQYIPQIAPLVAELSVFQRSPAWVLPRPDRRMTTVEKTLLRLCPPLQRLYRHLLFRLHEGRLKAMQSGSLANRLASRMARRHIARHVSSADKRRKLTPDYQLGCKRILISNDFYPAIERSNVELIAAGVSEVSERHVIASDGTRKEVDAIIFATGFAVMDALVPPGFILGPGGVDLGQRWLEQGAAAFRGVSAPGMPNLFFLIGPNSGLGHNSMILMIEAQIGHILACLDHLQRQGLQRLTVRDEAAQAYTEQLQAQLAGSVWQSGCSSWYLDKDGRNQTLWPGSVATYQRLMRRLPLASYHWE